ncbi:MAG: aromatic amino acid transaminase [Candidatus Binatia bacterium]
MFEKVATAPPDPILGLTDAFKQDPRTDKINLSVGVFQDAAGTTPVLPSVKEAERRLLEAERSKSYKPIDGDPDYGRRVRELLFGRDSALVGSGRAATAHTPGGTGGLRVLADFLARSKVSGRVWLSDPTWANHAQIFESAGLTTTTYPYFDKATNGLDFAAMRAALAQVPAGEAVLLHACCHNPTGVDPTAEQWREIAAVVAQRRTLPVVDFAYQGFGEGIEADAVGVRILLEHVDELAICSSFSKNFGLYNERTGALTLVAKDAAQAASVQSQVKVCVRANYSNPPAHGAAIVTAILSDATLRAQWEQEVAGMRERIASMRQLFVDGLKRAGVPGDFSFIARQKGMFSFSGLTAAQVQRLRDEFAIYAVGSGRINVAGMNERTMPALCAAIAKVM